MNPFTAKLLVVSLAALASAGVALASPASAAAPAEDVPTLVVYYRADALDTDSGAKALYRRLARAAEQVCPTASGSRFVHPVVMKCREQAIAGAVNKIHNQRLAAVHAASAKSG